MTASIVDFCRFVRVNGIPAGTKQTVEALEAARTVGIADRAVLKAALRAVICSGKEEWDLFDELFEAFWSQGSDSRSLQRTTQREPIQADARSLVSVDENSQSEAANEADKGTDKPADSKGSDSKAEQASKK